MRDLRFENTVVPHLPVLKARARRLCGGNADAADLVQDTLEKALRAFCHFDEEQGGARTWLLRVMYNLFVDGWRKRQREPYLSDVDSHPVLAAGPYQPCEWEYISDRQIQEAMATLEAPFGEVVKMRLVDERSYKDIGHTLNIPTATVGTRLARARSKMRRHFKSQIKYLDQGPMHRTIFADEVAGRALSIQ